MILNIRGTSGSGKTWAIREFLKRYKGEWVPFYREGRRSPLGYRSGELVLLGSYESTCGGCDNVGSARQVYSTILELFTREELASVCLIIEGLILSEDTKWTKQLPDLRVFFLTTTLDRCLEQIGERRKQAGNDAPLNPGNTERRVPVIERARLKLIEAGIPCRRGSARQAVEFLLEGVEEFNGFF